MPVNTPHPDYSKHTVIWERIRDVVAGEDAVKAKGPKYLPALEGQEMTVPTGADSYSAYKDRAEFHEAAGRTVLGLGGAIFRKDPVVDAPENVAPEDITGQGDPIDDFAKMVVDEVIQMGRHGVLVDIGTAGGDPFAVGYNAESIVNWRTMVRDGKRVLSLVVLKETRSRPKDGDPFETEEVERFRALHLGRLEETDSADFYFVTLWEKDTDSKGAFKFLQVGEPLVPQRRGAALDFIPFQFFGPTKLSPDIQKSPVLGLVNVNLSHYRTMADLDHGAHFTALPTPWVAGRMSGGDGAAELRIGAGVAWLLEENAEVGMLEYTGQGLNALEARRESKEKHMAVLGARLLEEQKAGVEAASSIDKRHRGENSLLASIAGTTSRGLTNVLNWMIWWSGGAETGATIELNKDFMEKALSPQEMVQLVAGWQQGGYGGEALFFNLKAGERLPADWKLEDWQKDIEDNGPAAAFLGLGGAEDDDDDDIDAAA